MLIPRLLVTRKISKSYARHRKGLLRIKNILPEHLPRKRMRSRLRVITMTFSSKKRRRNGKSSTRSTKIKWLSFKVRSLRLMPRFRIFRKKKVN
jgi:hypothetical protein